MNEGDMWSQSSRQLALVAAAGSGMLLAGAYLFQALGYAPCQMCFWQRYPHALAIAIGAVLWVWPSRFLAALGALSALTTAGIGAFHAGVEQKWWGGPSSCTGDGAGLSGLSGQDLLATNTLEKLIMCDEISWAFAGLSMPSWNAVFSALLCAIWIIALRRG
jgi:disulfide bond formation protein DsbB